MHLGSSSAAGVRFLASVRDGHGLKPSARHAGIDKEVGYRWLRERYLQLRRDGNTPTETTAELGFTSSRLLAWEADVGRVTDRHHLRVGVVEEAEFWLAFDRGDSLALAAHAAGVSRSTAYRWIQKRFDRLRESGVIVRRCKAQLRLTARSTRSFEDQRLARRRTAQNAVTAA